MQSRGASVPALTLALTLALGACGQPAPAGSGTSPTPGSAGPAPGPSPSPAPAAAAFTEIVLETEPGLSGLAVDAAGALWTIAERAPRAYRITLDAALRPAIESFAIENMPRYADLEGIAVLGGDRFAIGTEGRDQSSAATVHLAERRGARLVITGAIQLPDRSVGISLAENHGAEGVCGTGGTIVVAIEGVGTQDGRRWAPVVRIANGEIARAHRLWLTSETGKISGLDCRIEPDGSITTWAIERHFEVTRILRFALPPPGVPAAGPGPGPDDLTPAIVLDLGPVLQGRLNLEGIAVLPDGRLIAVTDNQWKTLSGPSRLLVFPASVDPTAGRRDR